MYWNHFFPRLLPSGGFCSCNEVAEPPNVVPKLLVPKPPNPLEPILFPRAELVRPKPDDAARPVEVPKDVWPRPEPPNEVPNGVKPPTAVLFPVKDVVLPNPRLPVIAEAGIFTSAK